MAQLLFCLVREGNYKPVLRTLLPAGDVIAPKLFWIQRSKYQFSACFLSLGCMKLSPCLHKGSCHCAPRWNWEVVGWASCECRRVDLGGTGFSTDFSHSKMGTDRPHLFELHFGYVLAHPWQCPDGGHHSVAILLSFLSGFPLLWLRKPHNRSYHFNHVRCAVQ